MNYESIKKYLPKGKQANASVLIAIFLFSVLLRLDNLQSPLGRHHEFLTGHTLSTLFIYQKNGIGHHYYAPVSTFPAKADLHLSGNQNFKDKHNYDYYVSYPPFSFIFPYFVFKLFNQEISIIGIRIISLIIHFGCSLLIYLILNRLFRKKISESLFIPSVIGYCLYIFASGNLWFHANVYFADTLIQLFFIWSILIFLKIIEDPQKSAKQNLIVLGILTFLGVYTEWLALFVAFYAGIAFFFLGFRQKAYFKYLIILFISSVLSLSLSVYQYSLIAGFKALKQKNTEKYFERSGYTKKSKDTGFAFGTTYSKNKFISNYEDNYSYLIEFAKFCLFILLALLIFNMTGKKLTLDLSHKLIFGVIILSIITHHFAFFNFTVIHDFSTLKTSVLLTLFIGYALGLFINYLPREYFLPSVMACLLLTGWYVHNSIQSYYSFNKKDPDFLYQKLIAEVTDKYGEEDEILLTNNFPTPVINWYAKRNVIQVENIDLCKYMLTTTKYTKALYVSLVEQDKKFYVYATRVRSTGDTSQIYKNTIDFKDVK